MRNKRGLLYPEIIFIVLNLVFFAVMLIFIWNSTGGKSLVEERYAKQLALMIDEAKPVMSIAVDMQDALQIASKNKIDKESIVKINTEEKKVTVKLSAGRGYSYGFFSNTKISSRIEGSILLIKIEEQA